MSKAFDAWWCSLDEIARMKILHLCQGRFGGDEACDFIESLAREAYEVGRLEVAVGLGAVNS